jgi:hypothetical protein
MNDLQGILESTTESVQIVQDPELRKIAFQEILRHALASGSPSSADAGQKTPAPRRPLQRRSTPVPKAEGNSGVRPEVVSLELSPDEATLLPWGTLTVDWKKFCWVLEASRLKSVDGLTNLEISYLIDKVFRESYRPEVINNLKIQIKKGIVKSVAVSFNDRDYRVWRILAAGIREVGTKGKVE